MIKITPALDFKSRPNSVGDLCKTYRTGIRSAEHRLGLQRKSASPSRVGTRRSSFAEVSVGIQSGAHLKLCTRCAACFCSGGTIDNNASNPAFQCRVQGTKTSSPGGTAELPRPGLFLNLGAWTPFICPATPPLRLPIQLFSGMGDSSTQRSGMYFDCFSRSMNSTRQVMDWAAA
jgi:hypothetical protein